MKFYLYLRPKLWFRPSGHLTSFLLLCCSALGKTTLPTAFFPLQSSGLYCWETWKPLDENKDMLHSVEGCLKRTLWIFYWSVLWNASGSLQSFFTDPLFKRITSHPTHFPWITLYPPLSAYTICPGSSYLIYIVTYYKGWVTTSWTYSMPDYGW